MSDKQSAKSKSKKTMPSSTSGLITFSSVTADTPSPTANKPKSSNFANVTPVYTGHDGEFAQASKKLIKKDSVTRLKGLSDVIALLKDRGETLLHDFLPYFIYVYCRLAFDNDRQIRDLINQALVVVVSKDKKQLQPFMAKLIGFWWILSCDPFKEIASRASSAFDDAIPAKKRPSVLLYLAPQILSRIQQCLKQSPTTMSDMTCTTEMEAEEKYERVIVSAIHSLGKLMITLSEDQNKELLAGVDLLCDDSDVGFNNDTSDSISKIGYQDVFSVSFWLSCFSHKSAPIRKAAYEIVLTLTSHCPGVISALENGPKLKAFFNTVVNLFNEPLEHNLPAALDAFITLYKNYAFIRTAVSLHQQIVPLLLTLLKTQPDRILDYVIPVLGVVPVENIALCTLLSDGSESSSNILSVVKVFSELLEISSTPSVKPTPATELLSARANVSAAEVSLLLLLRRHIGGEAVKRSESGQMVLFEVFSNVIHNFIFGLQLFSNALLKSVATDSDIAQLWKKHDQGFLSLSGVTESPTELLLTLKSLSKVIVQFQRATLQEINLSKAEWNEMLWLPLADRVSELLLSILHCTNEEGVVDLLAVSRRSLVAVIAVFEVFRDGLLVEMTDEHITDNSNSGVRAVVSTVANLANFVVNSAAGAFSVTGGVQCLLMSKVLRSILLEQESLHIDIVLAALGITSESVLIQTTSVVSDLALSLLQLDGQVPIVVALASASLKDVFSFLADHSDAEAKSKHSDKLLFSAIQHNSLSAVISFLSCRAISSSFVLSDSSPLHKWISDVAVHVLLEEAAQNLEEGLTSVAAQKIDSCSLQSRLEFVILVTMTPTLQSLARSLVEIATELWKQQASKISVLFLLSVLAQQLKNPSEGMHLPSGWMTDSSVSFCKKMLSLFLGRDRGVKVGKTVVGSTKNSDVVALLGWEDIQSDLLPLLPKDTFKDFVSLLCNLLNTYTSVVSAEPEDVDEIKEIQPRKWMRHLYGLLIILKKIQDTDVTLVGVVTKSIDLFSENYWRAMSADLSDVLACKHVLGDERRSKLVFALNALQNLESFTESSGEFDSSTIGDIKTWLPFYQNMELYYELMLCLQMIKAVLKHDQAYFTVLEVYDFCADFYGLLKSETKKAKWLDQLLLLASESRPCSNQSIRYRSSLEVIKTLLNFDLQKPNNNKFQPIKLHTPCYEDRLESGATITYISSNTSRSGAVDTIVYQPLEARVMAVHKEAGVDPYYSIGITEALTSSSSSNSTSSPVPVRELQTEWNKILLHHHSGEVDEVSSAVVVLEQKLEANSVCSFFERWLLVQIQIKRTELTTEFLKGISSESMQQFVHTIKVFSTVFGSYCAHLEETATIKTKKAFTSSTVAPLRGLVSELFSLNHDAQCNAWTVGTLLLNTLVSNNLGLGSGLWLPKLLLSLKEIVRKEAKLKQLSNSSPSETIKVDTLYSTLCTTVGCVLSSVQWNTCLQLAEQQLLPLAMPSIPSPVPQLAPALVKLLKSVWMHQHRSKLQKQQQQGADTSSEKDNSAQLDRFVASYEVEGLDLVLFIFTNGLIGYDDTVRLEAASALHFCFLNRNSASCTSLLEESLIREFLPQLESMVISEVPKVVGDNGMGTATEVESARTWNIMRLAACKLLDTCIVHNIDTVSVSPVVKSINDSHKHDSEEDVTDQEQLEQELDEKMFRECMSSSLEVELERRFVADLQPVEPSVEMLNSKMSADVDMEAEAEPVEDDSEELIEEATTESVPSSTHTTPSKRKVRYSHKALLSTMENSDPYGSVLCWLLCLQRIDALSIKSWSNRARCGNFLRRTGIMKHALMLMIHLAGDLLRHRDIAGILQQMESIDITLSAEERKLLEDGSKLKINKASKPTGVKQSIDCGTLPQLAVYGIYRTICTLPAMFRSFYNDDCNRFTKQKISQFIEERLRTSIIGREMELILLANNSGRWKKEEFQIKGSVVSGEVSATFIREETSVEIKIKLPASYPLKNVEVTCTSKIGVSEGRWRRWVLQMIQLLSLQDGSVIDAALMWKANIEKELEGVDPCPICYCILHTKTLSLPTLACPTCNNKFHNTCLYTWFKSSGKSKCVICQQPFFR